MSDERIIENSDGTIVVKLVEPVRLRGDTVERVMLRRLRAKDMRLYIDDGGIDTLTKLVDVACAIASPEGIVDELLCQADVTAVLRATSEIVGKFHGSGVNGGASSGSSAPDTASPPPSSSS
ncbi:MAG TPA: hypothetical protein VK039_01115 [Brevibacterium sp.]|nr:hypothetical protein [Brevibacterium sp.]